MHPISTQTGLTRGRIGYIGGSILARLLKHPSASTFDITVQTRSLEKINLFEKLGVKAVVGTNDDLEQLESLAGQAHVVFSCVSERLNPGAPSPKTLTE